MSDNAIKKLSPKQEIINALRAIGLDKHFGYRIVNRYNQTLFSIRHRAGAWFDTTSYKMIQTSDAITKIESEMEEGEFSIFGCCCRQCRTSEVIQAEIKIIKNLKVHVSHGFWPEHIEAEVAYAESEMMKRLPHPYSGKK